MGPRLAACSAAVKALAKLAFSSAPKNLATEIQRLAEEMTAYLEGVEALGPDGLDTTLLGPPLWKDGSWAFQYLRAFGGTIAGGTSEIQRNIIAERVLGLPRS